MNYEQLKAAISETVENEFETDQLDRFIIQAEHAIYQSVNLPTVRRNKTGNVTTDNPYLTKPDGFLNTLSMAVTNDGYDYLLLKDVSFIREAFPYPGVTGRPRVYGYFDDDSFILGPTPDDTYQVELHFEAYPETIVTANQTWLGDNFPAALLNACLLEALRFLKAEPEEIQNTEKLFLQSLAYLTNYAENKLKRDTYRR